MATVRPTSLYRTILREFRLRDSVHTFQSHRTRSSVFANLRSLFQDDKNASSASRIRELNELAAFLRANRVHQELLKRYNTGIEMTQEERSRLTARRVGLNMPQEYSAEGSQTS